MKIWTGGVCCSGAYSYNDNGCGAWDPSLSVTLTAGQTVYIECGSYSSVNCVGREYSFNVIPPLIPQPNETCALATRVPSVPYSFSGTLGATDDCTGRPYNDVFFKLTIPTYAIYTFDMCGSTGDTYMKLWTSRDCCSGTYITADDGCTTDDPLLSHVFTAGEIVYIECGTYAASIGNAYNFNITSAPVPITYYWKNNLGEGTGNPPCPSYNWATVTTNVVPCATSYYTNDGILGDDDWEGPFPLEFSFPYYGVNYTQFTIYSNGYLWVGGPYGGDFINVCIPNTTTPNNILAWFWDDLDPSIGYAHVFYGNAYYEGDYAMIVTFMNFERHYTPGTSITAQIILKQDGNIKYQYQTVGTGFVTNSSTIGIEDASGLFGAQYMCNITTPPLYLSGLAIEFGTNPNQLPVELTSFNSVAMDGAVHLQWVTASETNNDHFVLYRSTSLNGEFTQIATVNGAGSSASENNYSYMDQNLTNGVTYYYRLADVDINGTFANHDITVNATPTPGAQGVIITEYKLHQNYPNPFNPTTTITYDVNETGRVTLKIYNLIGQEVTTLVDEVKDNNRYQVTFDASGLAAGVYFYRVNVNDFNQVCKMVLLK